VNRRAALGWACGFTQDGILQIFCPFPAVTSHYLMKCRFQKYDPMKTFINVSPVARQLPAMVLAFLTFNATILVAEPEKISDSALRQIQALEQEKISRSAVHRKLDSQFVFRLKQNHGQVIAPGVKALQADVKFEPDGRVLVDLDAKVTDNLLAQINAAGGTVINSVANFHAVRALVPLEQLETLAGLPEVKFIRRASKARTNAGSVTSEGDVTHRANIARNTFATTGRQVKVGVLSDSVDYLASAQASGDLDDVTVLPGQSGYGSGEGTAMLEIVHDLAPDARLYFATAFNGEASFAQNILNLRSNGCDIIVDDVGYFDEPPFQDGIIAQAVNTVTGDGALYFSAAGNDGSRKYNSSCTWEGDFANSGQVFSIGGGSIHSFGATNYNIVLASGQGVDLFWADPLGASTNDYDLFLLDVTGSNVVASSLNAQNGSQDPYENIPYVSPGQRIVIVKSSGAAARFLHLVTSRGSLSFTTAGATRGHSATVNGFSVAAVDALNSYPSPFSAAGANPVETFSSDGPRRIFFDADGTAVTSGNFSSTGGTVRQKPDIAAADGVATYVFGQFFGTSAAAPHAAAITALLLSYNHNLTPAQIRAALTSSALDIEGPGRDPNSGAGIVMAYQALQTLLPMPKIVAGSATLVNESSPNGVIDPGETVTVSLSLTNLGIAATTNLTATLLSGGGVTFPSAPQNYGVLGGGGGTTNRLFTFVASGFCGDMNIATLQLQDSSVDLGTVSFSFRLGAQVFALSGNFDGVTPPALPPGWTALTSGAGVPWRTTANASDTPPNSIFVPDPGVVSDKSFSSPSFHVITPSAQLTFRQSMIEYYYGYAGGVLEISINNGNFTDLIAAGGSFVTNGYNAEIYTGYSNALEGRSVWNNNNNGFVTTVVNLPTTAAGQNVRLRWRFCTGSYSYGYGWYIDSVSITDGFACDVPVTNNVVVGVSDSPDPVVVGGNLTYTINVENTGPSPATGVSLTDVLPASFSLQSITLSHGIYPGPGVNGGGTLNFNLDALAAGSTATIVISGTADSAGLITNRVMVFGADPDANPNDNIVATVTTVIRPALSINGMVLVEGNSGATNAIFNVTLSPSPAQPATVHFATSNLTAIAGADYFATNGLLAFSPGVSNLTIAIRVIGDLLNEPDETFAVYLSNPTNATIATGTGIGTILNDDPLPYISVTDATVVKPDAGTTSAGFNVRLSIPSGQPVTVNFSTSDGTAIGGSDYVYTNNSLTFNPGQTNKTVSVTVANHVSVKPSQAFQFNLSSPSNAKIAHSPGLGTIITALPGRLDNFVWNFIPSPQSNGLPFAVTINAQDFFNGPVTNFSGRVALSGSWTDAYRTNTLFGDIGYTAIAGSGATYGNSFTPKTNLIVTHFRHYSGTKVSLWTDAGVLLASQNVTSVPGTWKETPLSSPVQLLAGHTYRLGFYTPGDPAYGRFDQDSSYLDATIQQEFYADGDEFPNIADTARWVFVDIRYRVGDLVSLPVNPMVSGNFTNGAWSGGVNVQLPATNVTLFADDGAGHSGYSLPFDVAPLAGQVTHYVWHTVLSPRSKGEPFAVTITAKDYFENTASNFTGTVELSGSGVVGLQTNSMLQNVAYDNLGGGTLTLGQSFTPSASLVVTHVRHYFGTKVSIWTDAGILLASQNVISTPGTWVETPLSKPLSLVAGQTYRIGVFTGGDNCYYRYDGPAIFANGTINQGYDTGTDGFPNSSDGVRWWLVDLRYTVPTQGPVSIFPAVSGNFADGFWSGSFAVTQLGTNLTLFADDSNGHTGFSNPFDVVNSVLTPPTLELPDIAAGSVNLAWGAVIGQLYQVQYKTNLNQLNWINLGNSVISTNFILSVHDAVGADPQRFYRVILLH
jgi:uncharacterized repeat protein (TIGR01451 family)